MSTTDGANPHEPADRGDPVPGVRIVHPDFRALVLPNAALEVLWEGGAPRHSPVPTRWLEGPVWFADHDCLYVSDVPNDRILRWSQADGLSVWRAPSGHANGQCRDAGGRLVTCSHARRALLRTARDGSIEPIATHHNGHRLNSPNDVALAPDGSLWFTDPPYGVGADFEGGRAEAELPANVYRLATNGALTLAIEGLDGPNGLAFSPDGGTLYVTETGAQFAPHPTRAIRAFDLVDGRSGDGTAASGRAFGAVPVGAADGIAVDEAGRVWSSAGDGVHCFAPDGTPLGVIETGGPVANPCFGGRHLARLLMAAGPRLLAIHLNVRGAALGTSA